MTRDRDVRIPKERTPAAGVPAETWREEPTDVGTDGQVFRGLKALGAEIQANKIEAARAHGALKLEVGDLKQEIVEHAKHVDSRLTKQDAVLADQTVMISRMAGQLDVLVPMARPRRSSEETKAAVDKALKASKVTFYRNLALKIVGGIVAVVSSGAFIAWVLS